MTSTDEMQDQAIDFVKHGQDVTLRFVASISEAWAHALRAAVPGRSDALPAPDELIDKSFDFGVQVLDLQRAFAHRLVRAAAPAVKATEHATEHATERSPEHATNSATRTVRK